MGINSDKISGSTAIGLVYIILIAFNN